MTTSSFTRVAARGLALGTLTLAAEVAWARLRPLPRFTGFDATGVEGPPDGEPLHLVAVGDSTITGPGLDDPSDIWIRQLARRLGGRRVRISSFAEGGSRTRDVLARQLEPAVAAGGELAFVSVGGNDAIRGTPLRRVESELEEIVVQLSESSGHVVLFGVGDLATVPRLLPPLDRILQLRGRAVDEIHARVAERHGATKADMWGLTTEAFRTRPEVFSPDLFHPSAEGHGVWADAVYVTVAPLLGLPADAPG